MELTASAWLWALAVVPAILLLEALVLRRDRERTATFVARALWPKVLRRPADAWRWVRLGLIALGTVGIVAALAGPRWGIVRERLERSGVDVVLVLDTSGSMGCDDLQPSRFFLAKAALSSLLDRLDGDRIALVAFEGEAYTLVPLTLDADAVGLFLDSMETGTVPTPGTSLGAGLTRAMDAFVDRGRANKAMVVVSDGEDLEGDVGAAVKRARDSGVVIHTVCVGTQKGSPVPEIDSSGARAGFKKQEDGSVVVSHAHPETLAEIARAAGGQAILLSSADTSLWQIASAIQAMERTSATREFSYRRKERYQWPLAVGLVCIALALAVPLPWALPTWRRRRMAAAIAGLLALLAAPARGEVRPSILGEVSLAPQRRNAEGRKEYLAGSFPKSLSAFEAALAARPDDPRLRINLADALYKNGQWAEAATVYRALASDPASPVAPAARFNLGNSLYQQKEFTEAVRAYRDALALTPDDLDTRRNLELALRAIEEQRKQQEKQQQESRDQHQKKDQRQQEQRQAGQQAKATPTPSPAEQEQQRFQQDTGMPKERAMQLLDALQQNEKAQQKRQLAAMRAARKKGKDW
jgi:Ca-activated chloride channel family protein